MTSPASTNKKTIALSGIGEGMIFHISARLVGDEVASWDIPSDNRHSRRNQKPVKPSRSQKKQRKLKRQSRTR